MTYLEWPSVRDALDKTCGELNNISLPLVEWNEGDGAQVLELHKKLVKLHDKLFALKDEVSDVRTDFFGLW